MAREFDSKRRQFLRSVGWAGLSAWSAGGMLALSSSGGQFAPVPAPSSPGPSPSTQISDEARSLAQVLGRRYPHLKPEQIERIASDLDSDREATRKLRDFALTNADEPDFTFHA